MHEQFPVKHWSTAPWEIEMGDPFQMTQLEKKKPQPPGMGEDNKF